MTVSDKTLEEIIHWKCEKEGDVLDWLRFCAYQWNIFYGSTHEYVEDGEWIMEFITGGWSENEAILSAMRSNELLWMECWHSSYRGGRYKFSVERYRSKS